MIKSGVISDIMHNASARCHVIKLTSRTVLLSVNVFIYQQVFNKMQINLVIHFYYSMLHLKLHKWQYHFSTEVDMHETFKETTCTFACTFMAQF